jgi:hypothetical protein
MQSSDIQLILKFNQPKWGGKFPVYISQDEIDILHNNNAWYNSFLIHAGIGFILCSLLSNDINNIFRWFLDDVAGTPAGNILQADYFYMNTDITQFILSPVNIVGDTKSRNTKLKMTKKEIKNSILEQSIEVAWNGPSTPTENLVNHMKENPSSQRARILVFPYSVRNEHWVALLVVNSHLLFGVDKPCHGPPGKKR